MDRCFFLSYECSGLCEKFHSGTLDFGIFWPPSLEKKDKSQLNSSLYFKPGIVVSGLSRSSLNLKFRQKP